MGPKKLHAAGALLASSCGAFKFDMGSYMRIQAMKNQFSTDHIGDTQANALMGVAGFSDMELFMSKQISADELKASMKAEYKDKIISEIMQGGGIDISNPLWRRKFFSDKTDAELFSETLPEPTQTIMRLSKDNIPELKEYGQQLLKKVQYKKFNKQGSVFSENMDMILMSEDKSATIKKLLKQQMLDQITDPLDRAMMYNMQQQQAADSDDEKINLRSDLKDLQTIKLFQGSVPSVSPVNTNDMFAFYQLTTSELDEASILNAALGDPLNGISDLDFERYFGSSAKQFSCRSHPNRLRVPCGVDPTVDECLASGCCYNPTAAKDVPKCYNDLYGKIGSGILREAFIQGDASKQTAISGLFKNGQIPTLTNLLKEDLNQFIEIPMHFSEKEEGQTNWWDAATVEGEDPEYPAHLVSNGESRSQYGRRGFQWKAHGPTATPYLDQFPGVNPTANPGMPGSNLDTYYQMWLDYTDTQDQTECALIHPDARVKCMENYEALADHKQGTNVCKSAGCCFNEDAFLEGKHACYRASDYGTCENLPVKFEKTECGYDGVSEMECLTNARCCYKPTHIANEPWCYYKYSATLEEDEWCEAWNLIENREKKRNPCWDNNTGKENLFNVGDNSMSNINNLVSQEQCEKAGCCFDQELTSDALDWIVEGLGQNTHMFRCFGKENPALIANPGEKAQYQEINRSEDADGNLLTDNQNYVHEDTLLTCTVSDWWNPNEIKRSCGDNLSYYQCVYVNKCCYKATVTNEPTCFKPEIKA